MRYTSLAIFLGTFLALACPSSASAQPPDGFLYGFTNGPGFLPSFYSRMNQHGPLFNYGPYYGYPPFEPYGPWNAYLQYNPWYYGVPPAHQLNYCQRDFSGHGAVNWTPSMHSAWLNGGWFHGCATCGHGGLFTGFGGWGSSCKSCGTTGIPGSTSEPPVPVKTSLKPTATDPSRYSGMGDPAEFAVFYSGLPTLTPPAVPAGGVGK